MALRHAESLIRQYQVAQRELPILQLCDRAMLYRVSWGGAAPRYQKDTATKSSSEGSVYQRRFSEKDNDPSRAYEFARTILDDMDLSGFHDVDVSVNDQVLSDAKDEDYESGMVDYNDHVAGDVEVRCEDIESSFEFDDGLGEDGMTSENVLEDVNVGPVIDEDDLDGFASYTSSDNVINATKAFRPDNHEFTETLKTQYATSDPNVPFIEDGYWSKVYDKLADFDEAKIQTEIEALDKQLLLAQENLQLKKQKRYAHEQGEVQERAERARIEQSFEEAIERAFQARAKSYEAWEDSCTKIRMARLRDEQEAVQGYDAVSHALVKNKESLKQHLQRKEDYRAAKIMHELRRHLVLAVSVDQDTVASYEKVIDIMSENRLSLKDLEFSDIKNKSLFIRLLERESALISDVHEREAHTEKMLDKFLTSSLAKKESRASENPIQHIQRLLIAASEGGQFETQKNLEQVIYLMEVNDIGVRDIGYGFIKKYSVFIRLINWEAERIASLSEREKFTAQILEEYIQHSVQKPKSDRDQKASR
jgi:bisphosphoglycerate-dependent phosphoglycerate mutase